MKNSHPNEEPVLSPDLIDQILIKFGFTGRPSLDLEGINSLFAVFCAKVPFDNIQKRIWFAGDRTKPLTGGYPAEFFGNWLIHGTGGTCWSINGGLYCLLKSLGFDAHRIVGSIMIEGFKNETSLNNHGSVLVNLDGIDYLSDANIGSFKVLPLIVDSPASTGNDIHDIKAVPIKGGFDIIWFTGINRKEPLVLRLKAMHKKVSHAYFLEAYDRTRGKGFDLFNYALYICNRFPHSIVTVGRMNKITISEDNTPTMTKIDIAERKRILIDELGVSEEMAEALPPDEPDGVALL